MNAGWMKRLETIGPDAFDMRWGKRATGMDWYRLDKNRLLLLPLLVGGVIRAHARKEEKGGSGKERESVKNKPEGIKILWLETPESCERRGWPSNETSHGHYIGPREWWQPTVTLINPSSPSKAIGGSDLTCAQEWMLAYTTSQPKLQYTRSCPNWGRPSLNWID